MQENNPIQKQPLSGEAALKTSRLAIASVVITIETWISVISLPHIPPPLVPGKLKVILAFLLAVGPIMGLLALREIHRSKTRLSGRCLAIASMLSYLLVFSYLLLSIVGLYFLY